ncbi:MAG: tetratricopeptide repeat protein [Fluviicola sp.]|nr:tetratricopeptide repeat protein [Fluviicola sp.]
MEKKLLNEAKGEFVQISNTFQLYYNVRSNLGDISLELGDYSQAIIYFKELEQVSQDKLVFYKKSGVLHNLGLCYFHLQVFNQAEEYLTKGATLQANQKDTTGLIISYMDIANLYYEQYQDALAIPYFEKAYQLSKRVNNFELKQNAALNMAVVEENRKYYKEALVYRAEYEPWRDSFNNFSY